MSPVNHQACLRRLAQLTLRYGVNLQQDQPLLITAPVEAADFVALITETAYASGSGVVSCLFDDPNAIRIKLLSAHSAALDQSSSWLHDSIANAVDRGAARLEILGPYPSLLKDVPVERVGKAHVAMQQARSREAQQFIEQRVNHCRIPFVTSDWANVVYPGRVDAYDELWRRIFVASNTDTDLAADKFPDQLTALTQQTKHIQQLNLRHLHISGIDTKLVVSLAANARWKGGQETAVNGVRYLPNLPTKEMVCALDKWSANGRMAITAPPTVLGTRIENLQLVFQNGVPQPVTASHGQSELQSLLQLDPDASRPGEIGLAVAAQPPNQSHLGMPMLDRNLSCHIGLGHPDPLCAPNSSSADVNRSKLHFDCGFHPTQVIGEDHNGRRHPLQVDSNEE